MREEEKKLDGVDCQDAFVIGQFEEELIRQTARAFSPSQSFAETGTADDASERDSQMKTASTHRRQISDSSSSIELTEVFAGRPPRPSPTAATQKSESHVDSGAPAMIVSPDKVSVPPLSLRSARKRFRTTSDRKALAATSQSTFFMKRLSSYRVREEWDDEVSAREAYAVPPPADIPTESGEEWSESESDTEKKMPRASVLNRHVGWKSLGRLVSNVEESEEPPLDSRESCAPQTRLSTLWEERR